MEDPAAFEPTALQRQISDKVCREIARRGMATPAYMLLEMSRPLNVIGAAGMHFFTPILATVADTASYEAFAAMLEHRGSVDYLIQRLDAAEEAHRPQPIRGNQETPLETPPEAPPETPASG